MTEPEEEEGRILPPYGGVTKCTNEPCREPLGEEHGVYVHSNRENGRLLMLCGPCSRNAQMYDGLRFPLVVL